MAVDCKLEAKFGHRPGVRLKRPRFKRGGEIYILRPQSITIAAGMRGNGGIQTHYEKLCYELINYAVRIGDVFISKTAYFNCKAQTIINQTEIAEALQLTAEQILNKIV